MAVHLKVTIKAVFAKMYSAVKTLKLQKKTGVFAVSIKVTD